MFGYSEYRLGTICKRFSSGKGISADLINDVGEYPVIGGNGLRGYTGSFNFDGECAVIGRQGAYCGNVLFFSGKGYMTEHAVVAQPNSENNARYLTYKLGGLSLGRFSGQAAQPGLSVSKLARLRIEMPPKCYQDKVASILSAYDNLIAVNNKRIKLLEQMAENLYKEWFVRFRFPGHETAEFENGIPKGWKNIKLFDLAKVTYGYPFSSDEFCDDETKNAVVRIRDVPNNATKTYTAETCGDKYLIGENAILVGMDGIFHMCLWNGSRAFLNQRVLKIESMTEGFCNYLVLLAIAPQVKFWENAIAGTTVAHLGDKHLKRMSVLLPDGETREIIDPVFRSIMQEKNLLFKKNEKLIKQRNLLLPRLMSGKLEVTPTQEPA